MVERRFKFAFTYWTSLSSSSSTASVCDFQGIRSVAQNSHVNLAKCIHVVFSPSRIARPSTQLPGSRQQAASKCNLKYYSPEIATHTFPDNKDQQNVRCMRNECRCRVVSSSRSTGTVEDAVRRRRSNGQAEPHCYLGAQERELARYSEHNWVHCVLSAREEDAMKTMEGKSEWTDQKISNIMYFSTSTAAVSIVHLCIRSPVPAMVTPLFSELFCVADACMSPRRSFKYARVQFLWQRVASLIYLMEHIFRPDYWTEL